MGGKYKAGDTVVIRKDLPIEDDIIVSDMLRYTGTVQTIDNVYDDDSDYPYYTFLTDDYYWNDSMIDHEATKTLTELQNNLHLCKEPDTNSDLYVVIMLSEGSLRYIKPFFGLDKAKEFVREEYENRCQEVVDDEFDDDDFEVDGEITSNGEAIIRDGDGDEWRIVSMDRLVKYESEGIEYEFGMI